MSETVVRSAFEGVVVLKLNRPDVLNAFNDEMGKALLHAVEEASRDEGCRCIVITGEGRAFCSGEDLGPLASDYQEGRAPDLGNTLVDRYNPLIRAIRSAPKPVIAAVNGVAAGAGASLALACDFRIAVDKAKLVLAFIKVGLVPDSGGVWFLTRMVGTAQAWRLAATGDPVGAEEAEKMGLFDEVVPAERLEEAWRSFALQMAAGPTKAYALAKRLVHFAADSPLADQLELEVEAQSEAGKSEDHIEGVQAFFAKRKPTFRGR
jgi:2-(1,2-epoxy-1,2-dihydrophenyl)acetyl-CoA isomerase